MDRPTTWIDYAVAALMAALLLWAVLGSKKSVDRPTVTDAGIVPAPRLPVGCVPTDIAPSGLLCVRVDGVDRVGGDSVR